MAMIIPTPAQKTAAQAEKAARDEELQEINRLRQTNELYEAYKPKWDFYLAAYEGGDKFACAENLFKHPREHKDDFEERCKRIHYLNYCEPLVSFFTDFIFGETIHRDGGSNSDFYKEFSKDVNKKGEDVETFMELVSDDKQIFGMVYVLVDAPPLPEDRVLSKADEKKLGIRPYWVLVRPDEVYDWVTDQFDKFTYLKRRQVMQIVDESAGKKDIERFSEWFPDKIKISDVDISQPEKPRLLSQTSIPNKLKKIPIILLRYRRNKEHRFMGTSFLVDFAKNNREIMNLTSLLQEFLYRQCFNILTMQTDSSLPAAQQTEGEMGTANVFQYPKGAERPDYIAPASEPAKFIQEERQRLVQEMYKRASQDMVNELFNGGKSSGFSKAQSFSTTVPRIASRAEVLEKAENELMSLTMEYMGKKWDGKIKYKDRYEITNIIDSLTQLETFFTKLQFRSETFVKAQFKRMVSEMDGKLTSDELKAVHADIEKMDMDDFFETMKLALIKNAGQEPVEAETGSDGKPVAGKDTPPKASTRKRATSTTKEIVAESTKKGDK
jgi:flagellar biosynthesis/type III secretory pathway protein FliH